MQLTIKGVHKYNLNTCVNKIYMIPPSVYAVHSSDALLVSGNKMLYTLHLDNERMVM